MIYLASYPRSGNTLLRMMMWRAFGVRTASAYQAEHRSWQRRGLVDVVGSAESSSYIKTHNDWDGQERAIYLWRKPHEVVCSCAHFDAVDADRFLHGQSLAHFKTWLSCHVLLVLTYAQLCGVPHAVVQKIGDFIGQAPGIWDMPKRSELNDKWDGFAARHGKNWRRELTPEQVATCDDIERGFYEYVQH